MSVDERLRELGLELPAAPAPVASFEPVVSSGDLLYTSGQIATGSDGRLVAIGRVGAEVDAEQARRCAEACALNVLAQLGRVPGGLDRIDRLVKLTVFVASAPTSPSSTWSPTMPPICSWPFSTSAAGTPARRSALRGCRSAPPSR